MRKRFTAALLVAADLIAQSGVTRAENWINPGLTITSTNACYTACELIIDGDFAGNWGSNNGGDGTNYITIDLGEPRYVASVYIVNRDDEFNPGELRILPNSVWLNLIDDKSSATNCGNPVGTGTLHCTTPMEAQFLYL